MSFSFLREQQRYRAETLTYSAVDCSNSSLPF